MTTDDSMIAADPAVRKAVHTLRLALDQAAKDRGHGRFKALFILGGTTDGTVAHIGEGCTCPACALNAVQGVLDLAADDPDDSVAPTGQRPSAKAH